MKKAIAILLAVILTLSVCACGQGPQEEAEEKKVSAKAFYGCWKYEDDGGFIFVNEDKTWEYLGSGDEAVITFGTYSLKEDGIVLKDEDGSVAFKLKQDGSKWLVDSDGRTLERYEWTEPEEPAEPEEPDADIASFAGVWKYDDCNLLVSVSPDGAWSMYDIDADAENEGVCYVQGAELVIEAGDGQYLGSFTLGADGRLYDDAGDSLSPYVEPETPPEVEEPQEEAAEEAHWFEEHEMPVNYSYDDPAISLVGGASVFGKESESYTRIPSLWYVERTSYQSTGDGNCIVTLVATSMTDGATMPTFIYSEGYTVTWSWNICDYYKGVILTEAEEDTFYSYNYESNGENIHVEFSYSYETMKFDDLSYLLQITLTVRMPEDYDGLVLVCYNAPESTEVKNEHDLIYEGQVVLPVEELPGWREMRSGLLCRISG